MLIWIFGVPVLSYTKYKVELSVFWLTSFVILYGLMAVQKLIRKLAPRSDENKSNRMMSWSVIILFGLVAVYTLDCRSENVACKAVFDSTFGGLGVVLIITLGVVVIGVVERIQNWRTSSRYPLTYLIYRLFQAINRLKQGGSRWTMPQGRSPTIRDVEAAAQIVERYLFKRLKTTDHSVSAWTQERARMIANALHEKQKWLVTPMDDTRHALISCLSEMLVHALNGSWDRFETAQANALTWK
jgi:hypothetical protein